MPTRYEHKGLTPSEDLLLDHVVSFVKHPDTLKGIANRLCRKVPGSYRDRKKLQARLRALWGKLSTAPAGYPVTMVQFKHRPGTHQYVAK